MSIAERMSKEISRVDLTAQVDTNTYVYISIVH